MAKAKKTAGTQPKNEALAVDSADAARFKYLEEHWHNPGFTRGVEVWFSTRHGDRRTWNTLREAIDAAITDGESE